MLCPLRTLMLHLALHLSLRARLQVVALGWGETRHHIMFTFFSAFLTFHFSLPTLDIWTFAPPKPILVYWSYSLNPPPSSLLLMLISKVPRYCHGLLFFPLFFPFRVHWSHGRKVKFSPFSLGPLRGLTMCLQPSLASKSALHASFP